MVSTAMLSGPFRLVKGTTVGELEPGANFITWLFCRFSRRRSRRCYNTGFLPKRPYPHRVRVPPHPLRGQCILPSARASYGLEAQIHPAPPPTPLTVIAQDDFGNL